VSRKVIVLLLFLLLFPLVSANFASPSFRYRSFIDTNDMYGCTIFSFNNVTGDLGVRATVLMDTGTWEVTRRDCREGVYGKRTYIRFMHVLREDIEDVQDSLNKQFVSFIDTSFIISNNHVWPTVFETVDGSSIFDSHDFLRVKEEELYDVNDRLNVNLPPNNVIPKSQLGFYYALAKENLMGGWGFYNTATGTWPLILGGDIGLYYFHGFQTNDLSNRDLLLTSGLDSGDGVLRHAGSWMDVLNPSDAHKAYFAFTDDINYYYYPYYIDRLDVFVNGYTDDSLINKVYSKVVSLEPTSNVININLNNFGVSETTKLYDIPNFGTELVHNKLLGNVPQTVGFIQVDSLIVFKRNPLYRQLVAVDNTWFHNEVFINDTPKGDNYFVTWYWQQQTINISVTQEEFEGLQDGPSDDDSSDDSDFDEEASNSSTDPTPFTGNDVSNGSLTSIPWGSNLGEGASLTNQRGLLEAKLALENKGGFFNGLLSISNMIIQLLLVLFLMVVTIITLYVFFIMLGSAYRKAMKEFKLLSDFKSRRDK